MRPFACVMSLNPLNLCAAAAGSGFRIASSQNIQSAFLSLSVRMKTGAVMMRKKPAHL